MKETTEHKVDRTAWPKGPWDNEPDREDFISNGFSCLLLRNNVGSWCGYVGVPENHPAFGKDYDDIKVDVHGGLTYASKCRGPIYHNPAPGMPENIWWLGFDTAHYMDLSPGMLKYSVLQRGDIYRDQQYTKNETDCLAAQLANYVV